MIISNYILSFPRSGNHWVRFCIEYLSGKPTLGCAENVLDTPIYQNQFPLHEGILSHVSPTSEPVWRKAHFLYELHDVNALLFIVRDYKECISRYAQNDPSRFRSCMEHYIGLIDFFETSNARRLLVYYEDLMESPATTLRRIHDFIGTPNPQLLEQLIGSHHIFRVASATARGRRWAGSISDFKIAFHWDRLTNEKREVFIEQWNRVTFGRTRSVLERYSLPSC